MHCRWLKHFCGGDIRSASFTIAIVTMIGHVFTILPTSLQHWRYFYWINLHRFDPWYDNLILVSDEVLLPMSIVMIITSALLIIGIVKDILTLILIWVVLDFISLLV